MRKTPYMCLCKLQWGCSITASWRATARLVLTPLPALNWDPPNASTHVWKGPLLNYSSEWALRHFSQLIYLTLPHSNTAILRELLAVMSWVTMVRFPIPMYPLGWWVGESGDLWSPGARNKVFIHLCKFNAFRLAGHSVFPSKRTKQKQGHVMGFSLSVAPLCCTVGHSN